jgi:putative transcriptional regulator
LKKCPIFGERKQEMVNFEIKTGIILLAEPFMMDPNFRRTALLLCEHSTHGSLGFVLNRPTNSRIDELIDDFPEFNCPVFWGGPVQTDTLHYLHLAGDLLTDSIQVADGVYWGGEFEELRFLVRSGLILPDQIRFFLGYSGWDEGQLLDETASGSWVPAEMHPNYLFKSQPEMLWQQVMYNKGDSFSVIASIPDGVDWN